MRVSVLLLEVNRILRENVVVIPVEVNTISNLLELVLNTIQRVGLLHEVLYRWCIFPECLERLGQPSAGFICPLLYDIRDNLLELCEAGLRLRD